MIPSQPPGAGPTEAAPSPTGPPAQRILVVDDEPSLRQTFSFFLHDLGYEAQTVSDYAQAAEALERTPFSLVITDFRLSKDPQAKSGLDVLRASKRLQPDVPVLMMTAYASTETALEALKIGAYDYFTKPFNYDAITATIQKALARARLARENQPLRARLAEGAGHSEDGLIGPSPAMQQVREQILRMAPTRTSVLILGESGTGKELVARALHRHSPRAQQPFIVINCGAIPEHLMESELFGHKRGTFTGAIQDRPGVFRAAHGGTLLLDEIGEMPLAMQVKLLRALQARAVRPVGESQELPVDVRVIAATHRDLSAEVAAGRFREDLYYRLNVLTLELPALRERPEDIEALARHFLSRFAQEMGKPQIIDFEPEAMARLKLHPFAGNVRELENAIEHAVALEGMTHTIGLRSLPAEIRLAHLRQHASPPADVDPVAHLGPSADTPGPLPPQPPHDLRLEGTAFDFDTPDFDLEALLLRVERVLVLRALHRTQGHKTEAAKLLGISFRSLRYRLEKHGLQDFEGDGP